MYYYGMSRDEILNSSRRFLYALYKQYVKRACENLGVSPDGKNAEETELTKEDYPQQFKKLSPKERKKAHKEFSSNDDFMKLFSGMGITK